MIEINRFHAISSCIAITIIAYCVLVAPVYKETKIASMPNKNINETSIHNKENNDNNMVENISKIASSVGIDADISSSNGGSDLHKLIHIKAAGSYQQLMQLIIELIGKSQNLFLLSLSILTPNTQDNEGELDMNTTLGQLS